MKASWEFSVPSWVMQATSLQKLATWLAAARMPPANFSLESCLTTIVGSFDDLPMASQYTYSSMMGSPTRSTLRPLAFWR